MYKVVILIVGGMVYLGIFVPRGSDIKGTATLVPLAVSVGSHVVLPFALNPSFMLFRLLIFFGCFWFCGERCQYHQGSFAKTVHSMLPRSEVRFIKKHRCTRFVISAWVLNMLLNTIME